MFNLVSKFEPAGDQPQAIEKLVKGINYENTLNPVIFSVV